MFFLNLATIAYAADGAGQDNNSSPRLLVLMFFPALLIIFVAFFMFRKNAGTTANIVKGNNEFRVVSKAHMRRLESQIEHLDKRLVLQRNLILP